MFVISFVIPSFLTRDNSNPDSPGLPRILMLKFTHKDDSPKSDGFELNFLFIPAMYMKGVNIFVI